MRARSVFDCEGTRFVTLRRSDLSLGDAGGLCQRRLIAFSRLDVRCGVCDQVPGREAIRVDIVENVGRRKRAKVLSTIVNARSGAWFHAPERTKKRLRSSDPRRIVHFGF